MLSYLAINWSTITISGVLLLSVAAIVSRMVINKRKGKSSCGCGCSSCAISDTCHTKK